MRVSILLLAGMGSAAPAHVSRQDNTTELAPWQITAASANSPSGRPGSSTISGINITIKDPNTIRLRQSATGTVVFPSIEATCSWTWEGSAANNFPDGVETVCTRTAVKPSSYGNFTMTLSGTSQRDFAFIIKETREVSPYGQRFVRVYEGEHAFSLGDGVWRQQCGGSGACSWQPATGVLPVEVQQELTDSVGSCEETGTC
ncbi:hypothetical protein E8E12_011418 [Didymella heteroderae]|uniref:AA1-like domain-containing protein n=1 Tax=Didymella heteroderae TaxID=1769908 RepID=A0A9P4X0H3_9PLEO|nr:hypothetical protein E8E12_011418 [Didymella heteroderae]